MKKFTILKALASLVVTMTISNYAYAACTLGTPSTTINADCGPLAVTSGQTFIDVNAVITGSPAVDQQSIVTNFNVNTSGSIIGIATGLINQYDITTLTNNGNIQATNGSGWAIENHRAVSGGIGTINNTGTIQGGTGTGIGINNRNAADTIGTINNSGTISGHVAIDNGGTITTITNTGTISGNIQNSGTITTINNSQATLGLNGKLSTNYNVIVNSLSSYGKLNATSLTAGTNQTTFGIYSGSTITKGTYASVLSGLSSSNLTGATSGMYNGTAWRLALNSGTTWDLIVDSSATNTNKSVQINANGLSMVYNQQVAAMQAALTYDCARYDANNLCVSVGGRYTYAGPAPSANAEAGLVVVGYRPVQTVRVGAFADQSVNISTPSGFSQSKNGPMWGLFANWNMNKDGSGLGVQASAVSAASNLTVTRSQLENTEAGSGKTQMTGQGYRLTTNYHQPITVDTSLVPYAGLQYTRMNNGSYTENTTANVTSPLSYNAMTQNTFSAVAGLGVRSHLAERLTGTASVGIQQNLNYNMSNYQGTSNIGGLESFNVQMPGNVNSMATASAGVYYDIRKSERVGFNVLWQQQPFIATNTTTALATYTIGF